MADTSSRTSSARLAHRRGDYGFDAPAVPLVLGLLGLAGLAIAVAVALMFGTASAGIGWGIFGLVFLASAAVYLHTTRAGKFQVWADILVGLGLRGDERVLDMGCGRGAVLTMVAELLPEGQVVGVDLWSTRDQSGNSMEAAQRNAEREGVAERVELRTADMRELPLADGTFDVVLSSLAIHNIPTGGGRLKAIEEAVRALRPGGALCIVDVQATADYAQRLQDLGMGEVERHGLGWRFWYGGPWMAASLVRAVKPA
jgi:ubiquinone/menaquinone biosynthesis C-methylase UbiE